MEFKPEQGARVAKLIQVGCDRAAATLSDCTGLRISVEAPAVSIRSLTEAMLEVNRAMDGNVATVVQRFSGSLSGHAIFVLDESSALILSDVIQARGPVNLIDLAAGEVLLETGSIILNACVGALGNVLAARIDFAVPTFRFRTQRALDGRDGLADGEPVEAVFVQTRLRVKTADLPCSVTIAVGFDSLERVLVALDRSNN
jgi:chemotaxis protein CheY-P-specific phosphatase CheC